jgi:hypothetical protein
MSRNITALLFALVVATSAAAQAPAITTPTPPSTTTVVTDADSHETRQAFFTTLRRYPSQVGRVLKLDPSLMTNQAYLANYPALAAFLAQHPEVAHSPAFYLDFVSESEDGPRGKNNAGPSTMEGIAFFCVFSLTAGVLIWLVRTIIDHRRWSRVSKVQADMHNKLLDRFTANEDLLAYIQTPAGKHFLESAPITVDGGPRSLSAPIGRILWSVQVGLVLAAAGVGLQYVSNNIQKDVAQPLFALGVLAVAISAGFILSAIVSFVLSRRLGLWQSAAPAETAD